MGGTRGTDEASASPARPDHHGGSGGKPAAAARAATTTTTPTTTTATKLVIVEVTTTDEVLPCHLGLRHASDLTMMVAFGDARERSSAQFAALFAASGWRLAAIRPTSGLFVIIEADPV